VAQGLPKPATDFAQPQRPRCSVPCCAVTVRVRPARAHDAEAIRSIYNPEVLESTVTFDLVPRSLEEQLAWLSEHAGAHPALVAVDGDGDGPEEDVVGFGSLSAWQRRPAYRTSAEDSIYVRRD